MSHDNVEPPRRRWEDHPTVFTPRLRLRPFGPADAPDIRRLAGDFDVARTTGTLPHPYGEGVAEEWIANVRPRFEEGATVNFAVTLREAGTFIGACGIVFAAAHERGEMGYWFGKPFWGHGYATEAAGALVAVGFGHFGLRKIEAGAFTHNPASCRVLEKIGMQREGLLRRHYQRFGEFGDVMMFGILAEEFEEGANGEHAALANNLVAEPLHQGEPA